ncbi:MAG TPA: YtxH domain-containing protein [Candidatus Barnesiella excrementipullorum]|uniref:YtxH domain-containing protein n=1 Tax=Candidatus Barnesiella excrementipullorum TaxID=2838479 RepID=A0A9D1VRA4_9BACT|nr:YtxH domain-containing protein [Candidatus Barnesiella excrementipullorum]
MKGLEFVLAFLGGAAVGAIVGLLMAPEKGEDTRARIVRFLKEKGISLKKEDIDELVKKIENNAPVA